MRQDTKMPAEAEEFAGAVAMPASAPRAEAELRIRELEHSYGGLRTIERLDLKTAIVSSWPAQDKFDPNNKAALSAPPAAASQRC